MIPLKDINPTKSFPVVNILLIVANFLVFFYQLTLPQRAFKAFVLASSSIPAPRFLTWAQAGPSAG